MTDAKKVVVNLATGMEDAERVMIAFLVAGAAVEQGKQVTMFLTKDAIKLALSGHAEALPARGARRSSACSSSTRAAAASYLSARSASLPAISRAASSSRMRRSGARRRSGNGSATARRSSATERRRDGD
jgi:hypothetical protein